MGNENSKDGEDGEQQEGEEGPTGSEKDPAKSQLPNGDVGTSSPGRPGDPTPEGEEGDPRESSEVDEHTKRMTIISENVYHYVGVVAGREYAREKGLTPTEGDLPVAPIGFMRPKKKKVDTEVKAASDPGKPPVGKEKPEAGKEVQSPAMELPHFYQPPTDDKDKAADKLSKTQDAPDGKAKDEIIQEKDDKENVGKLDSKPEKEVGSIETGLPRFYQSQGTNEAKLAPAESGKVTDVPTGKVESKTTEKDGEQKVEKKESTPGKDVKLQETELYQSDKNKTIDETGKSDIPAVPPGKTGDKKDEKDKKVGKPTKGSLESKPEQEAHTPATKIPRFYQPSNEDKKNGRGEPGKSETKDISNGTPEGNARDKGDKTEATETKLPRLYQSPSQDKTKAAGEIDKSESQSVPNGDAKTKTDQKDDKQENKSEKELKTEMPRFYSADGNEVKSDTDPDLTGERYTTALTVGPRSGKTEEPRKRQSVTINFLPAGSRKSLEEEEDTEDTLEQDVVEVAVVQKEKAEASYEKANLGSLESTKEPEVEVTQSKSAEKKDKSVRFDDSIAENETPPIPETKRVTSMVYVTPSGNTKSQEPVWFAAPVELTSTPPQTSADEPTSADEEDAHEVDPVPACGEELRQVDKCLKRDLHVVDDGYFAEDMACDDPKEGVNHPQKNNTTTVVILNPGKDTKTNTEHHDDPDAADDIITPKAATSLNSSSAVVVLSQGSPKLVHDVEEGAADYDVHPLKQPVPRSPEVDLGSGKILNAPSILMGSSITLSSNRQKCEVLPQDASDDGVVRVKTKPAALKEVRIEPSRIAVRLRSSGGTLSQGDSIDSKRATITDDVDASVAPLAASTPDSGNSKCDNYTQTSDVARKDERTAGGAPLVLRSRSVGFQCGAGVGDPKRTIATQKRPSLTSDSRSTKLSETEKKTRIPLVARSAHHPETKSVHPEVRSPQTEARPVQTPEARRGKGSPLPERKISVLRKDAPTNKSSPRTPPATSDSRNHKELAKRISLPARDSPTCSGHPVTPRTIPASPRVVRKRDDSKSAMHKTSSSSKSMDSIPRCTCLQVAGKDSPHGDKTVARQLSNPLGLREYDFNPPSKRPHWR